MIFLVCAPLIPYWLQQVLLFQLLVLSERNRHHAQHDAQQAVERPLPRSRLIESQKHKSMGGVRFLKIPDACLEKRWRGGTKAGDERARNKAVDTSRIRIKTTEINW